jgi:hypothetical protein
MHQLTDTLSNFSRMQIETNGLSGGAGGWVGLSVSYWKTIYVSILYI